MIFHHTPTIPPIEALTTFGVSAKQSDDAIGRFGTGFKYSVAGILRLGGTVTIHAREDGVETRHTFGTRPATIRDREFHIVTLAEDDGPPRDLGFSTDTGRDWEPWMLFRELHSNTLDEGGRTFRGDCLPNDFSGAIIAVNLREYSEAFDRRGETFLDSTPLHAHANVEFHPEGRPFVYYKGVRVAEANHDFPFTLNVLSSVSLTEDRTLRSMWDYLYEVNAALPHLPEVVDATCRARMTDETFTFGTSAVNPLLDARYSAGDPLPPAEEAAARRRALASQPPAPIELDDFSHGELDRACAKARRMGYRIEAADVTVSADLGKNCLGRVMGKKIYISPAAIDMGETQLLMTLIEEHLHLTTGAEDYTRRMQDILLEQIVKQYNRAQ